MLFRAYQCVGIERELGTNSRPIPRPSVALFLSCCFIVCVLSFLCLISFVFSNPNIVSKISPLLLQSKSKGALPQVPYAQFQFNDHVDTSGGEPQTTPASRPPTDAEVRAVALAEEKQIEEKQRQDSDEDTDPDSDAAPEGSGPRGSGDYMSVGAFEKRRPLCDGCGLCSLGKWAPWQRPTPTKARLLAMQEIGLRGVKAWCAATDSTVEDIFDSLARGEVQTEPWPDEFVNRLAEDAMTLFDADEVRRARPRPEDRTQQVRIRLLQALLGEAGDPDEPGMNHFARGVRLGINVRMPRTPAVYARKKHWRLPEQYYAHEFYGHSTAGVWRDNYRSAAAHADLIEEQLDEHARRGLAMKMTPEAAMQQFPDLTVVSMGAVAKVGSPQGPDDLRLVMDATHGVGLNSRTKPRDQDRCPTAADVKRVQREQSRTRQAHGLAVDVKEAHRLPPVHRDDWRYLACRARTEGAIYIYMYGVFGFAASAYWWSRLGGAAVRLLHHLAPTSAELWILMMADDVKIESTSSSSKLWILWAIIILRVLGVPLTWRKVQGGLELTWIGYSIQLSPLALGISASRAEWVAGWMQRASRDGASDVGELRSVVGRLSFVAGALEYEKPFLAPLFAYLAMHPGRGVRVLPTYVRLVLRFLAERIARRRHYPSAVARSFQRHPFRVDAQAEGDAVGIGGWVPFVGADGNIDLSRSQWFALKLDKASAPWAYYRGQPFRAIAALEALAVLVGYLAFGTSHAHHHDALAMVPGFTDNRGNKYVLTHLQTTRFPLVLILMELACQLESQNQRLAMTWSPREVNGEADRLAAGDATGFSARHRVHIDIANTRWMVLDSLLAEWMAFEKERSLGIPKGKGLARKPTKVKPFRERHPW